MLEVHILLIVHIILYFNVFAEKYIKLKYKKMQNRYQVIINNTIVHDNIIIAETFYERLKGLMFTHKNWQQGLLIKNCNSIHTCFMRYSINIICLDEKFKVIKIFNNLKPFRFLLPQKKIIHILEIPSNQVYNINIGNSIKLKLI